jgi:hypothetical protein
MLAKSVMVALLGTLLGPAIGIGIFMLMQTM